jgi:hypothetical protein
MITAIIPGCFTIIVCIMSYYLTKQKENKTKRLQMKLEYVSRQIEEFYGPIFSLVTQLNMYYETKTSIVDSSNTNASDKERINVFVRENYFYELHSEIRALIKNKYHLIREDKLPDSYKLYLMHSTQEALQIDIWNKLHIDTSSVSGKTWPEDFEKQTEQELNELKTEYNLLITKFK